MSVNIPVTTKYNGKGVDQFIKDMRKAEREAERIAKKQEREAIASTRRQIAEHRKVLQLTKSLDRDLAGSRPSFASRVGMATGISFGAVEGIQAAARFTVEQAKASVLAANEARKTERAFIGLSGGAAQAAKNLEAMERATKGLTTEQEQQAIANQLLGMNIVKTDKDLEKVVSVSRRLGKEFKGLGARDAADEFAVMISNMSVARLDSFGISSGNVRKRIDELMKTTAGMTREEAFFQATMEEADKVLGRLGPEVETSTEKFERMSAKSEDLRTEFGKLLLSFGDASGVLDTISGGLDAAADSLGSFNDLVDASNKLQDKAWAGNDNLKNLNNALDTAATAINPLNLLFEQGGTIIGNMVFNADELAQVQEEVAQNTDAAAAATEDDADAMEDAAAKAEELAKKLEMVNQARRDTVGSMMDIEAKAQQDMADTWDNYYQDTQKATADHNDKIVDIRQKAADEQEQIQSNLTKNLAKEDTDAAKDILKINKNLAKDLAKEEKDATRDIAKIRKDANKQIARKQEDTARQEKQQRRQRAVDAKGDERLFQYDMRQLAAEGDFNAILQAQERRAIEKQIESEKQVEEDRVAQENSRTEIKRMREDADQQIAEREAQREERKKELMAEAEEAKQERMAQAEERKAELQAQAEEELAASQQKMADELAAEEQNYQERMDELAKYRDEKLQEIEASKEESIAKLAEELAESGDLTKEQLSALVPVAGEIGEGVGKAFADGINSGFQQNQQIDKLLSGQTDYTSSNLPGTQSAPTSYTQHFGFASGGSFRVGGNGGTDSQLVQFWATPGEEVQVNTPAQQGGNNGGVTIQQNITVPGVATNELAALVKQRTQKAAEDAVNEYHLNVIVPWTNS